MSPMSRLRPPHVLLWIGLAACGESGTLPRGELSVVLVSGDQQEAVVGHEVASPLVVDVVDADGNPVPDQLVNFVVTSGGGSMFAGASITNSEGRAQDYLTVGTSTAEPQIVAIRSVDPTTGERKTYGEFQITALSDVAVSALPYGVPVSAARMLVPRRMGVIAYDQYLNPASGAEVTFTLLEGDGSITGTDQVTGLDGVAAVGSWTFGAPGTQRLGMTMDPSVPLANGELVGNAYETARRTVVIIAGDGQTAPVGQIPAEQLVAGVVDTDPSPVFNNYFFEWKVEGGGGRMESYDEQGQGTAALVRLGVSPGPNTFTASVYGIGSVTFTITGQ
ncbi:MAG TPA: Ig-like domain-containing protein [Gemmatimonadales bacterium]|nr:Ig-like domain-containing protein [Gemmatimonadales bacterium]